VASVADLLRARTDDAHLALLFEDSSWTWSEVVAAGAARAALATELRRPGPFHIGVLLENVPEFLFWIAGAAFSGAAIVGINPTRRGEQLAGDIAHTDCQLIVTDRAQLPLLDGLGVVPEERVLLVDMPEYQGLLAPAAGHRVPEDGPDEATTLLLTFTSGSTGAPKAVICTQRRLARMAMTASERFGLGREDVLYESMPMFHGNALMANIAPALGVGATVALRSRFSASGFLPDVRRFDATYFNYVGRALAYVLATPELPDDADNTLRLGFGTEASALDMERFSARFACTLQENYGSSEGVITIHCHPDQPKNALGLPIDIPGMDVIVADPDTGTECPRARFDEHGGITNSGEAIGEMVNRAGAPMFEGYYNNDQAMDDRLRNGWYWSGDLGYRDEDGWFYFAGRSSDWLRVDSENFAAAPIERILFRYPGVVVAAVYPVPDPRTGDQVMAALELADPDDFDPGSFGAFLAAQPDLGTKWAPRFVRLVESMPLTGTNKVNKQPLRADRWETDDAVYWQPERGGPYERMARAAVDELAAEFAAHGRVMAQ
jgi:acyl-CoA synthetase (AMP-forming)/AMP-acid ligase II